MGDDFMSRIWEIAEKIAGKKISRGNIGDENIREITTEKIFLLINSVLWVAMGFVVSLLVCGIYLNGIVQNVKIVFFITGYFSVIMFLTAYIFLCRKS